MWERLKDENDVVGSLEGREKDIWHDLVTQGAKVRKHYNNAESARRIIREIIALSQKYGKLEPLIQTELAMDPHLIKTTAGKSMKKDLQADIERARAVLAGHHKERPQELRGVDRVTQSRTWKREFKQWDEERKALEKRLERLETSMDKLSGFHVSWQP